MRAFLMSFILLAGLAGASAAAAQQRTEPVERRLDRIEQELRAVQRRVFPGGRAQFVQPENQPAQPPADGSPASGDALASLAARVDALETQLRVLTGQVEEQGFRFRQLEEQITRLRADLDARTLRQEPPPPRPTPPPMRQPDPEPPATSPARPQPSATDAAEEAYNAGFRLWDAGRFAEAQQALDAAATRYPSGRWTSWMRNLQGRAYLDDNKPATAARIFLANYQNNPRGERAADSLYFLGQALARLNRRTEACRVYDELAQVYPNMRDWLSERLPRARTDARCGSASRAR
ncbi:MAG: YbgF trimerization domain-containing protein [Sphingosinicella sp.]